MLRCPMMMNVVVIVIVALTTTVQATFTCPIVANGVETLTINLTASTLPELVNRTLFETVYDCKQYAPNATRILMSYNDITSIDEDSFGIFFNLIHLDISHNNISELHVDTFNRLRTLEELDLSYNKLTRLEAGLIRILSLVSVSFNNNNISYVEPGIVSSDNVALSDFYMNNNSLTYLDPWPFLTYQTHARYVRRNFYFRYNNISQITNFMNWTYDLEYRYEVFVYLEYNNIQSISNTDMYQYDESFTSDIAYTIFLTLRYNITNNPYFCDCKLYPFAQSLITSVLRYSRVEEFRYVCNSPSNVAGIDWLHDIPMSELVCNQTDNCPYNCFCQDRPHNDTFLIDCRNAGLTTMPDIIPDNNRSKIELLLDNNFITELEYVSYLDRVYNISLRNNSIKTLDPNVLESLDAVHLDFRNNRIRTLPSKIKKYNYDSVRLNGNPLWCDCDSMWLKDWLTVDNDVIDKSLKCDSEKGDHIIAELSLHALGCTNETLIAALVAAAVALALIVVGLIFAYRCPYATKVLLNKFTCGLFHPRDKAYEVPDEKEVDIYMVYDDHDEDVVGWVRHFLKKLNSKRPMYSVLNPARFMEPGSPAVTIPKWIGKSKRVIVVLSEGIFKNEHRNMEIDDAERRLVEAACHKNDSNSQDDDKSYIADETDNERTNYTEINHGEDDNNLMNAPKMIYIKFNTSDLLKTHLHEEKWQLRLADKNDNQGEWQDKLNEEPWKSRMASKRVLSPDERLFWAKLRFELPSHGNGLPPDGNFVPHLPRDDDGNTEIDTEHRDPKDNGNMPALYNIQCEMNDVKIRGKGKALQGKDGKGQVKSVLPLVDSLTGMLEGNRNPKSKGVSDLRTNNGVSHKADVLNMMIRQNNKLNTNVNCQNDNVEDRINFISLGEKNPLGALTSKLSNTNNTNTNRATNIPYSHHMNNRMKTGKNGLMLNSDSSVSCSSNNRCSSATSARSISIASTSNC